MKGQLRYTREYAWTWAPQVWRTLAKTVLVAFIAGVVVGAVLF
ncbi:hypothetical protein [Actinomadura sp. NEAU-AAG7]|nr:hypothetical protein [Actinomadura sp. NEAU-AAG7]